MAWLVGIEVFFFSYVSNEGSVKDLFGFFSIVRMGGKHNIKGAKLRVHQLILIREYW